jgi:ABC-type uncharacterized transport system involved in gliding motility auxiliary subunit
MKPEWRRFAPLGLYIALIAAVAAAVLYFVQRNFGLPVQISLGVMVLGMAASIFLDPDRVRQAFSGRQARYGSNALVLSLAFFGILAVVNYLVFKNDQRWDLTEDKQYTLVTETLDTLSKLPEPVTALAFFTANTSADSAKSLLEQYKFNGNGKFDYQFIDPDDNPVAAQEAKITRDGTVVLKMGASQELVTNVSEQELTGGLLRLMSPEKRPVYFLTGHGEYSPDDTGDKSYSQVKRALEGKNYVVNSLNLLATNQIPADAKVIVIAGPRQPVSAEEVDLLKKFVENGGGLIVEYEPSVVTEFGEAPDPLADFLAQAWGITLKNDIIIDPNNQQGFAPFAYQYGSSPITQKMQNVTAVFPSARSVSAASAVNGVSQVELVLTAPNTYAETNLEGLSATPPQYQLDEGQDQAGPVSLAVTSENFETKGKVIAFGDSDFVIDANFAYYGNSDLFINSVDWAAGQEQLISLTPKNSTTRLVVPPQTSIRNLILLASVIVIPGLALVAGIVVWVLRRRRG